MTRRIIGAAAIALLLCASACDGPPPPPPPPPPSDAGVDAGAMEAGIDAARPDAQVPDGGHDAGPDGLPDAARTDAGPPPASGPYADLVLAGAHESARRFVPPANQVGCAPAGPDNLYIVLSEDPTGATGDTFEIDVAGPIMVGPYVPSTGPERPGTFGILYRVSPFETYGVDESSSPCSFEVTSLSGGVLEATFGCVGLASFVAPAAPRLDARGQIRCNFP